MYLKQIYIKIFLQNNFWFPFPLVTLKRDLLYLCLVMNLIKSIFLLLFICCFPILVSAQIISVYDTKTAADLVDELLGVNSCLNTTPSSYNVSGNTTNNSYGTFTISLGSAFPFNSGVILSTRASKKSEDNSITDVTWNTGDTDIEKALNLTTNSTKNTTFLEFEFEAKTTFLSFTYLFASDEYRKNLTYDPCNRPELSDGVAILIKDITSPSSDYENIAVIDNGNNEKITISSFNIHPDIFVSGIKKCDKKNEGYFDSAQYNSGLPSEINFAGQTTILKAKKTNLIPGNKYKIKFVIAEGPSQAEFSAIFVEAGSFTSKIDLGKDRLVANNTAICNGENYVINTGISGTHNWTRTISGVTTPLTENSNTLTISQEGTYKVEVSDPSSSCIFSGEIKIEYAPGMNLKDVPLTKCNDNGSGSAFFDLTDVQSIITNNDPDTTISGYYEDSNLTIEIINSTAFEKISSGDQIVYAKGINSKLSCYETAQITLKTLASSQNLVGLPNPIIKEFAGGKNSIELITPATNANYEFSIDGINYQSNTLFTSVSKGNYIAYVRNTTTCEFATYPFTILDYPTFFTPNGDEFNDIWKIDGLDLYPQAVISIFDRFGKLLKQMNSNSVGWNGNLNGTQLPADDYWFRLVLNDNQIVNGHFSLKR